MVKANYANSPLLKEHTLDGAVANIEKFLPALANFLLTPEPSPKTIGIITVRVNKFFGSTPFIPGTPTYPTALYNIIVRLRDLILM